MSKIKLVNVRLSFPQLFEAKAFQGGTPKFSAVFLLDKKNHASKIAEIKAAMEACAKEKWPKKLPPGLKYGLRDGSEKEDTDGYGEGVMFFSASSQKRIPVVDRDLSPLSAGDDRPYAGCYVNATVNVWAQDNEFGKRVNFGLVAVQFSKKGEPFGAGAANPEEEFEKIEETADDTDGL